MSETLLTSTQAAKRLGVSRITVYEWIKAGLFPHAFQLSELKQSPYRIPEQDVIAIEQKRREQQHAA